MKELKQCPHCGGEVVRIRAAEMVSPPGHYYIGCRSHDCNAVTSFHVPTWAQAVEMWNRRESSR